MEECNNDGAAGCLVLHCVSCRAQSGREALRVFTAASPMWEGGRERNSNLQFVVGVTCKLCCVVCCV